MWTVDQIPAGRLIAPLVVLDVSASAKSNPDYEISVEDIARWEQANGQIPLGAVVMARTGWGSRWSSAKKLPQHRWQRRACTFPDTPRTPPASWPKDVMLSGLGIDTANLDRGSSRIFAVNQYTLAHGLYVLTNVANLDRMPANGAVAMVAPMKVDRRIGRSGAHSGAGQVMKPVFWFPSSQSSSLARSRRSSQHIS